MRDRHGSVAVALALALAAGGCDSGGGDDGGGAAAGGGAGDSRPRFEDYIRGDRYPRLIIEVDRVEGSTPRQAALRQVTTGLAGILDKPSGIEATLDGTLAPAGADHAWTIDELRALADESFDLEVPDDTIKMHVMYVDGHSDRDTADGQVLGLAWDHTHVALFQQTIESTCARLGGPLAPLVRDRLCEEAELAILTHEVGHLLGLVDAGLPMVEDHVDPDHAGHDRNERCVMYWAYEGSPLVERIRDRLLAGRDERMGFDAACLADIAAVRDAP